MILTRLVPLRNYSNYFDAQALVTKATKPSSKNSTVWFRISLGFYLTGDVLPIPSAYLDLVAETWASLSLRKHSEIQSLCIHDG